MKVLLSREICNRTYAKQNPKNTFLSGCEEAFLANLSFERSNLNTYLAVLVLVIKTKFSGDTKIIHLLVNNCFSDGQIFTFW